MEKEFKKEVVEEVQKYKWIESEKLGYDIGFERAAKEWMEKHGELFEKYYESLTEQDPAPVKKPARKTSKKPSAKAAKKSRKK